MAIYRGEGGAGDSNTDATISQVTAQANIATTKAAEAAASAAEALDSKNTITQMTAATGAAGTEVLFNSITGVLTVPRGDKGDTGDTGAPGIDGNDGIDGTNGLGWTGGSYNGSTGIVTFTSTDGLGFSTTDLRGTDGTNGTDGIDGIDGTNGFNGADGADGLGWTGGSYNGTTGIVTFTSTDGLGFSTTDLRGTNGTDGTDGIDGIDGTNGINGADGADGLGWTGGSYNSTTGIVTFTSTDGLGFVTGDLRAPGGLFLTDFSVTVATAGTANLAYNNTNGVFTYTPPDLSGYYPTSNPNGYTDDQTASEIKTAYESNANTNAYTDAEKSKLAGVEANANNYTLPFADNSANWNTAYSYSQVGHLPLSGGTLTGNIDFNDGVRARFGASDDLQIYHTGTLSYIQDTGTGSLNIETNGTHINLRGGAGNNDMAKFQSGGGVQLFHSGSEKLEVTSTGIDVTGTVVATGGNSTNWNTAYGWGDHATAGYYPASNPNGYTNDQTAAEILTAIKTVDGSGSGLDADTVDGLHASDIVESSNGISGNLDTEYDAQMFGWSSSTTGKPASSYGQGISIVSSGKTHNNSNNWITQLGFGTTDNTSYFRTKVNSGGWSSWRTIWNSSNDGSGSGLDADLLDGQHGSYYYSSDNLPLKIKAGGSGPSTENLNTIANSVSTGQLEYRGFNSSSSNAPPVSDNANGVITVGQHGGNYNAQLAFSSNGSMYFRDNPSSSFGSWRKVYDAGNDGSGSGLDADLLDGQHGSAYLRSNVSATNSVDLRAPVFYDSDNTANYLDSPTSSVFRLNGSTAVNLAVGGSNKLVATSTGVGIGTSSPSEKLHVQDSTGSPQIRIDNQGTASGIASLLFRSGGAGNPSSIIQSGGTSSGNQGIVFKHGDFGAEVERMRIDSAGAVTAYNSLRAPIFYDSNNTGYYTDPASISRMAYVYANKVYFPANASYKIGFWGGTTNYTIGMSQAWDATNGGRVAGETTSDYNMYFTMSGGTNRGFVFRNSNSSGSAVAGIDAGGNARFNGSVGVNGSTVIDPSRNLININDFTSTGTVYLDNPNNSSTTDPNIDSKGALTSGTAYSYHALFKDGNGNIKGRITHNQYGAQFSNLSDYRAKEDYQEVENATSRLMSIPVRNFQWIGSDLRTDGFLAHEIAEVIPEAVVGEKDAVLEDGTPDYQSIDQSKIVPLLVKTIQEQQAVIESLEARLIALENA